MYAILLQSLGNNSPALVGTYCTVALHLIHVTFLFLGNVITCTACINGGDSRNSPVCLCVCDSTLGYSQYLRYSWEISAEESAESAGLSVGRHMYTNNQC